MNILAKELPPRNWRTQAMHKKYEMERVTDVNSGSCPMCEIPHISEFTYWRLVKNSYPYDSIAKTHHMLVTKRHIDSDRSLNEGERNELFLLKETTLNESYNFVLEALPRARSIPGHYHLHLIVPKVVT